MIGPTDMQLEESLSGIVSGSWASLGEAPLRTIGLSGLHGRYVPCGRSLLTRIRSTLFGIPRG